MRVPIYIAVPLLLLTMGLVWWANTRHMDFLTPPSEAKLERIRFEALASLPTSSSERDAISIKVPDPDLSALEAKPEPEAEPIDLGDLESLPSLDSYADRTADGSDRLIQLAILLENQGHFQRALLAYERILDLAQPDPEDIETTVANIQRLRPTLPDWNPDPEAALPVVIHIGTGSKLEEDLPPVLDQITRELDIASSGLIRFSHNLHIGKSSQPDDAPIPVAIWITGPEEDSPSTDVLSFTSEAPETLRGDLLKTTFNLVRGHLAKSTAYTPPPEALDDPHAALQSHITRLLWQEFAALLNP